MAKCSVTKILLNLSIQTATGERRQTLPRLVFPDITNKVGQLDYLQFAHFARTLGRRRSISLTLPTNFQFRLRVGGTIERDSDNSAEIKAFASFSSRIAKFAVILDVAISLPRFLFQGTVSLIRERRQSNIIRGESQRSGGGFQARHANKTRINTNILHRS